MDNKEIVVAFWQRVFQHRDATGAAEAFLGATYTQHNPTAVDGAAGLVEFAGYLAAKEPDATAELVRVVADGDLVATHSRFVYSTGPVAAMDFWRLEDGRIVEHWDVIQAVPATARNGNGMF